MNQVQDLFRSERFRRLLAQHEGGDHVGVRQELAAAIAESSGRERAFWLLVRSGGMINLPAPPVGPIMAETREALAAAPGDVEVEALALLNLLGLAVRAERVEDAPDWVAMLHRVVRRASDPCRIWFNLGTLQWRRGRPRAAVRNYTLALAEMARWDEEHKLCHQARFYMGHCYRALAALEAGLIEQAQHDVAAAERLLASTPTADEALLRLAQATLALHRGDAALARQRLQMIRVGEQVAKYRRTAYPIRAEVEAVAGLIALAEGNQEAFAHFIARAQAIAQEHQLPLTARRIEQMRTRALGQGAAALV
ncbi:MAG: hypothetical protein ACOY94_18415 [Bacillota bacterium]